MGPFKMLRYLVIALLAAGILLTAGSSMARSQDPAAAIVGRAGQPTMTGGGYALIYHFQRASGASVGQSTPLASGGSYQLWRPVNPPPPAAAVAVNVDCPSSEKSSITHPLLDRTQRLTEVFVRRCVCLLL